MQPTKTKAFYFSATGGTEAVLGGILKGVGPSQKISLHKVGVSADVAEDELAIFAVPVYEGRIPPVILERFSKISGNKGPAVVIVVYGNRDYEDALVEMQDTVTAKGFTVVAAAAFVAEHSAYARLASGRPDQRDLQIAEGFGETVMKKKGLSTGEDLVVKGNRPYKGLRVFNATPICEDERCNRCKICVSICPQSAIDEEDPTKTDPSRCMSCVACIKKCPQEARQIPHQLRQKYDIFLEQFTGVRKEPEIFIN